jgi:hypothetical protein
MNEDKATTRNQSGGQKQQHGERSSLKHMTLKHHVPRAPQALLPPATNFNEDEPHHATTRVT